ncbi:putative inactive ATP-dependent zinc metalloprotease FTSHI 5 [Citrus sinensis]|uniref:Inactive ATP-dependent zinc metalloprotease FTSHI 5 n=1 Tax=Citrus sinensis TaxID=2711 RepID=A0ACB8LD41_CITSI|nr:putative inactive ATP-dependent zinc metalloprotease FTSHI 5 [Citrus sinensis]
MDAISISSSLTTPFTSQFPSPYKLPTFCRFTKTPHAKIRILSSRSPSKFLPLSRHLFNFSSPAASTASQCRSKEKNSLPEVSGTLKGKTESAISVTKTLVYAVFCIAVSFSPFKVPAIAATVASEVKLDNKGREIETEVVFKEKDHEYADYTRRLLETVSNLLKIVEEVRGGNGDVKRAKLALKAVKMRKEELQDEIMSGMYTELRELRLEKEKLVKRVGKIIDEVLMVQTEIESLKGEKVGAEELLDMIGTMEREYDELWERVGEIDDKMLRRETVAMSIGVRELCFIERECEELVKRFSREMRRRSIESSQENSVTKLSRSDIQEELESAQRKHLEQMILPSIVEVEDLGPLFYQDSLDFALRIKQCLKDSRELQRNLEARIRKNMKKLGNEKRFVVRTPEDEVVKGFPEVELKWMFGDKEVVVPKAIGLHLYHGWKAWREEAKADLKRRLLEDVDFGKQYVAQRQERILLDRDRVVSKTWYNEDKSRWEMDPVAVPYAVSNKIVESARIRHDWGAMYLSLKGDDKEFYVDIKEFEVLFEDFGGFDELYMKMLACGIPTAVHVMRIPFSELDFYQQFLLIVRLAYLSLNGLWKTGTVSFWRDLILENVRNTNDDIMMMIVFPLLDRIIPYSVRMKLGMAWPQYMDQSVGSTWYLGWQSEVEMSFNSRKTDDLNWSIWFLIRTAVYGYVLFHILRFMKRKIPRLLGFGPMRRDPNFRKLRRVKAYFNYRVRRIKRKKKAGIDPIKNAFERMKRVKNPPIPLTDFASVESMREEINEVVAFLQNPSAFQEMGARAPRGVLIVGERGTGKTSLALAIAAEARVPVVNVEAQELEAGLWVGQSASNVRELFQTARDLAPVIIFVEDFDLFAGVRGQFIHTKQQDHESFINQLLVELDGFEKQDGVVLMATTRNIKQIDEALQRPGRMDRIFNLQKPTQSEREKILRIAAQETMDEELIDLVDWRKVAEKTALLRPIELKLVPVALEGSAFRSKFLDTDELMSYCGWFATFSGVVPKWFRKTKIVKKISRMLVDHLGLTLTKEDLQNVVDLMEPYGQISNGIELLTPPLDWTRETKLPHAVWAAGRGLIALLLPNFDTVDNLWLEPCAWECRPFSGLGRTGGVGCTVFSRHGLGMLVVGIGCTKITKAEKEGSMSGNPESRSYLEKKLVFCFGSYAAAQLLLPFGEENLLSSSEIKQAQEIATRMVLQYGWGPDDSPAIYYSSNAAAAMSMGSNHEYEMATKVEKVYDLAYYKAKEMLQKNRKVLEKVVEELLEYEILTGKDLERLMDSNGGIREKEPFFLSKVDYQEDQRHMQLRLLRPFVRVEDEALATPMSLAGLPVGVI